ncbi:MULTISPECIES: hypothetical protein [unclassified Microbacterium]|uniref:hypothetical protein n=1 Tax=unclassified Microbacterium TaxID=2609290 RepID=UPI0030191134
MTRRPAPLPGKLGAAFSVGAALDAGATERRLRASDLGAPFWGVRSRASVAEEAAEHDGLQDRDALAHRALVDAYAERMPEHRFFTGLSALVVWCGMLPVPAHRVEVGTLLPHRAPRGAGVRGRQFAPHLVSVRAHDGVRVSSPASTWVVLAPVLPFRDLVAVGALLVTPPRGPGGRPAGPPLATVEELRASTVAPRTGVAAARRAVELVRPGARSRTEVHLWLALVRAGLPEPVFDLPVRDAAGHLIGIFDLAFPERRVLAEYQGDYHRLSPDAWARDIAKRQRAREAGYTVVEITRRELYPDASLAVARVRAALRTP